MLLAIALCDALRVIECHCSRIALPNGISIVDVFPDSRAFRSCVFDRQLIREWQFVSVAVAVSVFVAGIVAVRVCQHVCNSQCERPRISLAVAGSQRFDAALELAVGLSRKLSVADVIRGREWLKLCKRVKLREHKQFV